MPGDAELGGKEHLERGDVCEGGRWVSREGESHLGVCAGEPWDLEPGGECGHMGSLEPDCEGP